MRGSQLPISAERRHTLPAPNLFGNQPAPLRPCISVSFSLRYRATLLCADHLPQDAVHVALTTFHGMGNNSDRNNWRLVGTFGRFRTDCQLTDGRGSIGR